MASFRLLVIDDREKFLTDAGFSLRCAGYVVETAGDRESAIQQLATGPFDLILVTADLLPLSEAIRASERALGHHGAVLIGLASDQPAALRTAYAAAGVDDCDLMPSSRSGLLRLAARWTHAHDRQLGPDLRDLGPAYLQSRRADARQMRVRLSTATFGEISAIAHRMHGTGATYGFPELTVIGAELESAADGVDAARVTAALAALDTELQRLATVMPMVGAA